VTGNTADADGSGGAEGGGVAGNEPVQLRNSIVAGNAVGAGSTGPDCGDNAPPQSLGGNLIGNTSDCGWVAAAGDLLNVNPLLASLTDNGGPTQTHALLTGSPAIDAAGPGAPPTDQRGIPRSIADIGAYELAFCRKVPVNRIGTAGNDVLTGTPGPDGVLSFGGNDTVTTQGGADAICASGGKDTVKAGGGKDIVLGQNGNDTLKGGGGKDTLKGGGGKDTLSGAGGNDTLNGQGGKDTCKGGGGKDTGKGCETESSIP
jgi:Ca2+-binding RTX toxin-like protein